MWGVSSEHYTAQTPRPPNDVKYTQQPHTTTEIEKQSVSQETESDFLVLDENGVELSRYDVGLIPTDFAVWSSTLSGDFNNDDFIDLKNPVDAYASAANYLNNMGWNDQTPCFYKIDLKNDIPKKFLNYQKK